MYTTRIVQIICQFWLFACPFYCYGLSLTNVEVFPPEEDVYYDLEGELMPRYLNLSLSFGVPARDFTLQADDANRLCFSAINMPSGGALILTLSNDAEKIRVKLKDKIIYRLYFLTTLEAGASKFIEHIKISLAHPTAADNIEIYDARYGEITFNLEVDGELSSCLKRKKGAFARISFSCSNGKNQKGLGEADIRFDCK
jgi:hypothetical protein